MKFRNICKQPEHGMKIAMISISDKLTGTASASVAVYPY